MKSAQGRIPTSTTSVVDGAGNRNSQRSSVTEYGYGGVSAATVTYTYDGRLKLSSEVRTGTSPYNRAYNADAMGNRITQNFNGASSTFIYDNDDELTGIRGSIIADIGYNANGEQTYTNVGAVPATFAYDYEGQLLSITKAGATTSFTYDALGRRMSRAAGGVTTAFQFAGSQVLTEKQGSTTTGTYTWGSGLTRRNGEYPLMDGSRGLRRCSIQRPRCSEQRKRCSERRGRSFLHQRDCSEQQRRCFFGF